jgi:beta-lactamase regulating signal transducer with metallopeptidase domain/C-terminal processing protease CtpA/Prc
MSSWFIAPEEWLVRCSISGGVLLLAGAVLMLLTRQPARRQRLGELSLLCGLLAAGLCALPAWTPWAVPLWSAPGTKLPEPGTGVVADSMPALSDLDLELLQLERLQASNPNDPAPEAVARVNDEHAAAEESATTSFWQSSMPWFVTAYIIMMGYLLLRCVLGHFGLRRMWAAAVPPPLHVQRLLTNLTQGWRRMPRIGVSARLALPVSFGLWRPTILITPAFCDAARQEDLRQVLVHELTHLKRLDSWSCLMLAIGQSLYFHLPWFWWLRKQVRLCQEYVADAAAASLTSTEDYAEYLVSLSGGAAPRLPVGALVMGVKDKNSDLFRRVTMLLNASHSVENRPPRWWSVVTAGAFFALAVLISGIGLRATAQADEPTADPADIIQVIGEVDVSDAELVVVQRDPADEERFILVSPEKAGVRWIADPAAVLTDKGQRFVWTKQATPGKQLFTAQAEAKDPRRLAFFTADPDGEKHVIVIGSDGKVESKGKNVQVIEGKDGKKIIVIIDKSASTGDEKKTDKKEPVRQIIERKIEVAKPKVDVVKPVDVVRPKIDVEKQKQQADEAIKRALEQLRKTQSSGEIDAARKALEDALKQIKSVPDKPEMEKIQKTIELHKKAAEDHADRLKKYEFQYKSQVEAERQKAEEALRKAKEAIADKAKEADVKAKEAAVRAKEAAAAGAAKAQEAEAKAREKAADAALQYRRAVSKLAESSKGGGKLGIAIGSPSDDLIAQLDLPKGQGIIIQSVVADSPAAKAGFQPHDILVEFNGKPVSSEPEAFVKAVAELKSGAKLDALVLRKGKKVQIKGIVLADAKPAPDKDVFIKTPRTGEYKFDLKEAKPGQFRFELKDPKAVEKLDPEKLKAIQKELENLKLQLPKEVDSEKLRLHLKELDNLKLPKEHLEKLELELKELPDVKLNKDDLKKTIELELKGLKQGNLKKELELVQPKGEVKVIELAKPTVRAGEKLHVITEVKDLSAARFSKSPTVLHAVKADGKKVTITLNRDNEKFTAKYDEGNLSITATGVVKDGKAALEAVVVKENDKDAKYASLDKVPEQFQARVKRLVELAEKDKVEFKIDE